MNSVGMVTAGNLNAVNMQKPVAKNKQQAFKAQNTQDSVEIKNTAEAPKISRMRLFFSRLTNEQINAVNKSGKLPQNAKFIPKIAGGYKIGNNFFGLRAGTKTLPAGYELKKGLLGFTKIVPKDTEGLFIRNAKK